MESSKKSGSTLDSGEFARGFAAVVPLIREEWPTVEVSALEATNGDLDKVANLIATHTDHTKVLIRRQLAELHELSQRKSPDPAPRAQRMPDMSELIAAVKRLEALAAEEARKVSTEVLPRAEAKVKENVWLSLFISLGVGMILGLWMAAGGRRGRHG